jgi:hypothetical protein
MDALDRIDKKEIRNLLGKSWLTHDGMWFYHTYQEVGIEKANKLNKAAIRSLAPIEINRVKKVLGINEEKIVAFEDIQQLKQRRLNKKVFHLYTKDEVQNLLINAGFSNNVSILSREKGKSVFHCVVAIK